MSKISIANIVRSQLPEYIQSDPDYGNFILFLEAYYRYLGQTENRTIESLRDIDQSLARFTYQFRKELNYITQYSGNEALFLRHLKSLYSSKGSEASFKLLFRLLGNKDVEVSYPGDSILIPSDGRWIQEKYVIAEIIGDAYSMIGQEVQFGSTNVFVENVKPFGNQYQIILESGFLGDIQVGETITFGSVTGTVKPIISGYSIRSAGKGFRIGQIIDITDGNIISGKAKVTKVNSTGGILSLKILSNSSSYLTNFVADAPWRTNLAFNPGFETGTTSGWTIPGGAVINDPEIVYQGKWAARRKWPSTSAAFNSSGITDCRVGDIFSVSVMILRDVDKVGGSEYIRLDGRNITATYVPLPSAMGNQITTNGTWLKSSVVYTVTDASVIKVFPTVVFSSTNDLGYSYIDQLKFYNITDLSSVGEDAVIDFTLGGVAKMPGYFESNKGFLSDTIYLQDSKFYQTYSYLLKIDEQLDKYSNLIKQYIHPSGFIMFGESMKTYENLGSTFNAVSIDNTSELYMEGGYVDDDYV